MATKLANVRMNASLKDGGDAVLRREGLTFTSIVNSLYEYLVCEQQVPECLMASSATSDDPVARRRKALRRFSGCLAQADGKSLQVNIDDIRAERLARQ